MTTDSLEVTSESTNISSNICLASSVASNNCLAPSITSNSSSSAFHAVAPKNKSFSGQSEFFFYSKVILFILLHGLKKKQEYEFEIISLE
jgi:hypothetical protein